MKKELKISAKCFTYKNSITLEEVRISSFSGRDAFLMLVMEKNIPFLSYKDWELISVYEINR